MGLGCIFILKYFSMFRFFVVCADIVMGVFFVCGVSLGVSLCKYWFYSECLKCLKCLSKKDGKGGKAFLFPRFFAGLVYGTQ